MNYQALRIRDTVSLQQYSTVIRRRPCRSFGCIGSGCGVRTSRLISCLLGIVDYFEIAGKLGVCGWNVPSGRLSRVAWRDGGEAGLLFIFGFLLWHCEGLVRRRISEVMVLAGYGCGGRLVRGGRALFGSDLGVTIVAG